MDMRVFSRGNIYPGSGDSTLVRATPAGMEVFHPADQLFEGNPALPVTPLPGSGVRVGQFSLAQATVGLALLLGAIYYMDRRIL